MKTELNKEFLLNIYKTFELKKTENILIFFEKNGIKSFNIKNTSDLITETMRTIENNKSVIFVIKETTSLKINNEFILKFYGFHYSSEDNSFYYINKKELEEVFKGINVGFKSNYIFSDIELELNL